MVIHDPRGKTPTLILEKVGGNWQIRNQHTGKKAIIGPRKPSKPYARAVARRLTQ